MDENCAEKPLNDVIAKINRVSPATKITAIVIAPNYILTVGHWGYLYTAPPNETQVDIEVGGQVQTYKIVDGRQENSASYDYGVYRIATLGDENASLNQWVDLYIVEDELGKEFVIGSYGPQPQAGLPAGVGPMCCEQRR